MGRSCWRGRSGEWCGPSQARRSQRIICRSCSLAGLEGQQSTCNQTLEELCVAELLMSLRRTHLSTAITCRLRTSQRSDARTAQAGPRSTCFRPMLGASRRVATNMPDFTGPPIDRWPPAPPRSAHPPLPRSFARSHSSLRHTSQYDRTLSEGMVAALKANRASLHAPWSATGVRSG